MARRRGEFAPSRIVGCIKAAITLKSFEEGMKEEQRLFNQLLVSPESRAMQHVFFAERAAAKLPKEFTVQPAKIKSVGIIGSGTMGGGIAMSCAEAGLSVLIEAVSQEFLDRGARPVLDRLTGPIQASVHDLVTDGDRVVALWRGTATALDGKPYVNEYAWSMAMRGGEIARVVASLDLVALDDLIRRVPV